MCTGTDASGGERGVGPATTVNATEERVEKCRLVATRVLDAKQASAAKHRVARRSLSGGAFERRRDGDQVTAPLPEPHEIPRGSR